MNSRDIIDLNAKLLALYVQVCAEAGHPDIDHVLAEIMSLRDAFVPDQSPALQATFNRYVKLIALYLDTAGQARLEAMLTQPNEPATTVVPPAFAGHASTLGQMGAEGLPGISVVTCSMNRTENLIKAIPSWLANREIAEVLIVDWSSRTPVAEDLAAAGIADPRIRILRVDDEPRWILSYAFNAGFRAAACDTILKVDADIVLSPDFFQRNHVVDGSFIAGNWRTTTEDQAHVNGFFFVTRKGLAEVGGFNEHITTYGWDDDDIYDRMSQVGMRRRDVAPNTIFHLDHDDEDRIGEASGPGGMRTVGAALTAGTKFMIRRNRYLAMVMPHWDHNAIQLPFRIVSRSDSLLTVTREGWVPSAVPGHIQAAGRIHSLTELLAWRLGRRVFELEPERIELLLARADAAASRIDVEVALAAPDQMIRGDGHYLVLEVDADVLDGHQNVQTLNTAFTALIAAARARHLTPVLRAPYASLPAQAPQCLADLPLIPSWEPLGKVPRLTAQSLFAAAPPPGSDYAIDLTADDVNALSLATPAIAVPRPRLFMDVQHGLGNRLRALGSAAAIAAAGDRELVIVWEPDDHCDGRFSDLFEYDGAVLEQRFLDEAPGRNCDVYNYMPHEAGSEKGKLVDLGTGHDIYARAAFVLNHPSSTWDTENRFLRGLTPIEPIRTLVASVRHPNDLSAHVRMEGGAKAEHLSYEKAENWRPEDHALIDEWRTKSHFKHFLNRIDVLIAEGRANHIFLAADMPETYAEFQHHYGDRLAWLPRSLYDRSTEQLHYALADAILLSRSPLLLGSTWSSFSELAMRLAPQKIAIEMSGKDF